MGQLGPRVDLERALVEQPDVERGSSVAGLPEAEKFDLIMWKLLQIERILMTVSADQADFNADIATLTAFISGLPAQIAAITQALQAQGVTDLSTLDALAANVNEIAPTLANLPGGAGTGGAVTPPPPGTPA